MRKRTSLLRRAGWLSLVLAVFVLPGAFAQGATSTADVAKRADVVVIDAMAAHGKLELPPVVFLHDKHTEALKAAEMDCNSCHNPLKEGEAALSFSYKNADSLQGDTLKRMFHQSCIGCHADMKKAGAKTGPQEAECRSCHMAAPVETGWNDMRFDKVMHAKHVESKQIAYEGNATNCGACHHVYDAEAQKLVWGKNKEDSCRACHVLPEERAAQEAAYAMKKADSAATPAPADDNGELFKRPTFDKAAHQSCVNCHLAVTAKKEADVKSGPDTCAGCHSAASLARLAEENAKIAPASLPRLERGQDDAMLLLPRVAEGTELKGMMQPVAFNHKFHESVTADCRTCHHKRISACSDCHTFEGKPGVDTPTWATAMHKVSANRSCVGCHIQQTQQPSCIGCHSTLPTRMSDNSCAACHVAPTPVQSVSDTEDGEVLTPKPVDPLSLLHFGKDERKALAERMVAQREAKRFAAVDKNDVPETVRMGLLSNEYEPSDLPHRKIVDTLVAKQKDNRLAVVFHQDKATLCQGCHHNSPVSLTPPKCVSCHGQGLQQIDGLLSLKAAYHQQCMTCHEGMNQKPAAQECADCHKTRIR